ncbi:IS200/IS605 family transposase [Patescibacteria group bacterium]|nr:IS200/IS605 family transposase [Patescibacteria group bacterium]
MSEHIYKRHSRSLLLYHVVCPAKYRRKVFTEDVAETLKNVCIGIDKRYEIHFVEIRVDEDHVHFLVQSVPVMRSLKSPIPIRLWQRRIKYYKSLLSISLICLEYLFCSSGPYQTS